MQGSYRYHYQVANDETGDFKSHLESQGDDGVVSGNYRFLQPDGKIKKRNIIFALLLFYHLQLSLEGCVRVVHYTADSAGFHPTVTYEGPDCGRSTPAPSAPVKPILSFVPGQDSSSFESNDVGLVIPRPVQSADPLAAAGSSVPSSIQDLLRSFDSPIPPADTPSILSSSSNRQREPKSLDLTNDPAAEEKFLLPASLASSLSQILPPLPNIANLLVDKTSTETPIISAEPREEEIGVQSAGGGNNPEPADSSGSGLILEVADPTSNDMTDKTITEPTDPFIDPADFAQQPPSSSSPFLLPQIQPIPGTIFLNGDGGDQTIFFRPPSGVLRAYVPAYQVIQQQPSISPLPTNIQPPPQLPPPKPTWSPYFSAYVHQ